MAPFNLLAETPFVLKVVTGSNAGAEIGIEKGKTYTIGKDPESCDIIFQDLSVSRHHASLEISPEGTIEISDLGSKNGTIVNGILIEEKETITTQDVIAVGSTVFMIIDRDAPQETIYSPINLSYEPHRLSDTFEEELSEEEEEQEEEASDWKKALIPGRYLAVVGSLITIFLIVFLSFFSLFKTNHVELAHKEPVELIRKALAKFEGVQFSFNPASGKLFLVGHVLTAIDAQEMRFQISEIDSIISEEDNVVIDEYVNKAINDILSENGAFRGVTIQSPSPGKFVVIGYLETNEVATQLNEYLAINFPYPERIETQIVIGSILNTELQAIFVSKGFGSLTFQYSSGDLIISGNYSKNTENAFKALLKEVQKVKGVSKIKNYALPTASNMAATDISQRFQVTGASQAEGKGYSVVLNNKIYMVGDVVEGMTITEIDLSTILLEKDGIKYKISYTR